MHREPAPGMSVHRQRRVADILKRRLLRSVLTYRNLANFVSSSELSNDRCPTGYRVILLVPIWYVLCVYAYARTRTLTNEYSTRVYFIFGVGFALSFQDDRQCESLCKWNGKCRFHAFFVYLYQCNP